MKIGFRVFWRNLYIFKDSSIIMNPVPNPITVCTGEQTKITKTIDDFFWETREFVEQNYELPPEPSMYKFSIRSGELAYYSLQITDDRVNYLAYGFMILATVFETRTELNFVHYTFFRNLEGLEEVIPKKIK